MFARDRGSSHFDWLKAVLEWGDDTVKDGNMAKVWTKLEEQGKVSRVLQDSEERDPPEVNRNALIGDEELKFTKSIPRSNIIREGRVEKIEAGAEKTTLVFKNGAERRFKRGTMFVGHR